VSQQNHYMLMFTLGPVQPFIAQARKTRDLWIGSLLLSKLMEAAMDGIEKKGKFIFPARRMVGEIPDIPNKYIAVFNELSQARDAAESSQKQIKEQWQEICNAVWKEIIARSGDEETRKIWQRQTGIDPHGSQEADLASLFEVYWAIVERSKGQKYGDWFEETESRLAARKRLRDFKPKEEPGEKSIISGEREILRKSGTHPDEILQFWKNVATARFRSPKDINQKGKERLDAIDTVKRFAMEAKVIIINGRPFQKPFPSTSSIATASFVERLLQAAIDPRVLEKWDEATSENKKLISKASEAGRDMPYLAAMANNPRYAERQWILQRDGDLYFAETFVPRRLFEDYEIVSEPEAKNIAENGKKALNALLQAIDALKIPRPTPYYAVIQMDGDNMGILLSGVQGDTEHTSISQALSAFSRETALDLVEKQYPARLVFAGGDDVLAFAPLVRDIARDAEKAGQPQHVLDLVDRLQGNYRKEVTNVILALPNPQDAERLQGITTSSGIVIAHHYTSLSYVLRSAREAERIAKKRYGKNALVVTLIRRSGEQTRVGCHWRYPRLGSDDHLGQPIALFSRFYRLFQDDVLSPKCVYILLEEAPALVKMEIETALESEEPASAMQSEIKRVLKRQRDPRQSDKFPDAEVDQYAWYLTRLAAEIDADEYPRLKDGERKTVELHSEKRRYGLVEVLGWLLVMAFLARKVVE